MNLLRPGLLELNNIISEGRLEELKINLGRELDTRRFLINFPEEKIYEWKYYNSDILNKRAVRLKDP